MLKDNAISQSEYDQAMQEQPYVNMLPHQPIKAAPDFAEHVRKYVEVKYGVDALYKEGLQVYTTVDLTATKIGQAAMDAGLA